MRRGVILILWLLAGCAAPRPAPTDAAVSLGGAYASAYGHTQSAEYDVQQAVQDVAGPVGKAFLTAASNEHGQVIKNLDTVGGSLQTLNAEYASAVARSNMLEADVRRLLTSREYHYGRIVVWAMRGVIVWAVVVLTFPLLGLLPGPWGYAFGLIGRAMNPLSWGHWFAELQRIKTAGGGA